MAAAPHRRHEEPGASVCLALLTVSDTRTLETDESGRLARRLLASAGHRVFDHRILPDEPERVRAQVVEWLAADGCDGVLVNGGTGISPRDRTYEAVAGLLDKRLDGFGELFRMLSYGEIGSSAMLSRAVGGVASGRLLFSVPGSPPAVNLALETLLLPELAHLAGELKK
jgi:molybdopterin adenylyltransferase